MRTRKLELACPVCASGDVFYTCTPNCCFNHVCANCGSTFEPVTTATGRTVSGCIAPEGAADASDPTAGCAKCDGTTLGLTEAGLLVCLSCGAELALEYTEVAKSEG